jgi:hypothetical protein
MYCRQCVLANHRALIDVVMVYREITHAPDGQLSLIGKTKALGSSRCRGEETRLHKFCRFRVAGLSVLHCHDPIIDSFLPI